MVELIINNSRGTLYWVKDKVVYCEKQYEMPCCIYWWYNGQFINSYFSKQGYYRYIKLMILS